MNIPRRDWIYNSFWELQILDRGGNALQSSQNADCDHRQSQGADQERNGQKDQTIFRGVCDQHGNAQQRHDAACQTEKNTGTGDQSDEKPCEQIDCQDNGTEQNFDNQLHVHTLLFYFHYRELLTYSQGCGGSVQLRQRIKDGLSNLP